MTQTTDTTSIAPRAERQAAADQRARELPPVPAPATFHRGAEVAEIVCYADGTLGGRGAFLPGLAAQYPGLAAAQARRRAWLALDAAREDV